MSRGKIKKVNWSGRDRQVTPELQPPQDKPLRKGIGRLTLIES